MGASEGDMSLFASMNMQIAWLNSGTDAVSYRTKGASKATPGFDVMDYGQETYEFGSSTQDARHFDKYVLKALQEDAEILSELFNSEEK